MKKAKQNKEKPNKGKGKLKKPIKVLIIIFSIIATLILGGLVAVLVSPRAKFLACITNFALGTLNNPSYLAYNLDVMEICRDYIDGDIEFSGDVLASDIKGFGYTSSAKVQGVRSFDYKQISCKADAKVLFIDVGEVDAYADDKTLYMIVPSFDNLAYSLTTNTDLFFKAPMLNGNLDLQWFGENIGNLIQFTNDIDIQSSGKTLEDEDGTKSEEYLVTIPQGKGVFIWELLGMDIPDHDINMSIYITRGCKFRRIFIDIGHVVDNATLTIDGTSIGTCIFNKKLPDNEDVTITFSRRGDYLYSNYMDMNMVYNSKDGSVYHGDGILSYNKVDNGYDIEVKRLTLYKGGTLLGQMYFTGNVHPTKCNTPPIGVTAVPLNSIKNYSWEELRDNFDGFINDVREDVKSKL